MFCRHDNRGDNVVNITASDRAIYPVQGVVTCRIEDSVGRG